MWTTILNIGGVILLFGYGMPCRVRTEGATYSSGCERRYDWLGKLGLFLIVTGTAAHLGALFVNDAAGPQQ